MSHFITSSEVETDLLSCLLPFLSLVAKEPHCKPLGRSLCTDLRSFRQGRLFDQSCSSWHKRWGVCLTLPVPNQQQSSPERQFECSSQGCRSHFNHEQSYGKLWVGKSPSELCLNSFSAYSFLSSATFLLSCWMKTHISKFKI